MKHNFSQIVDEVNQLDIDEKIEIVNILEKSIAEAKREEFLLDYRQSLTEKHRFSDNIDELKSMLDES